MTVLRLLLTASLVTFGTASIAAAQAPTPPRANCPGDCNRDGAVLIGELITGVNEALGTSDAGCDGLDINGNARIDINELIVAVGEALTVCPRPVAGVEVIAGATLGVARGLSGISSVLLATVSAVNAANPRDRSAAPADDPVGGAAASCPLGGSYDRMCESIGPSRVRETVTWAACDYSRPGGSLDLDGTIALTLLGACPSTFIPTDIGVNMDFTVTLIDAVSGARRSFHLQMTGILHTITFGDRPCPIKGGQATLDGTVTSQLDGVTVGVLQLSGTDLTLTFSDFNDECQPATSTMEVDGMANVSDQTEPPFALDVQFDGLTVTQHQTEALEGTTDISGGLQSSCFGGAITMQSSEPLAAAITQACPSGGVLQVSEGNGHAAIHYGVDGAVDIDNGADTTIDEHFASCLDQRLRECTTAPGP
jgi:hypothetical protein